MIQLISQSISISANVYQSVNIHVERINIEKCNTIKPLTTKKKKKLLPQKSRLNRLNQGNTAVLGILNLD